MEDMKNRGTTENHDGIKACDPVKEEAAEFLDEVSVCQ